MKIVSRFIPVVLAVALSALSTICLSIDTFSDPVTLFLAKYMRFSRSEIDAVARGEVVAKSLDTEAKSELAFFGITHVNAPASLLVKNFRNIETFKKAEAVIKVKKLSNPPVRDDFNTLKLEEDDIKDLRRCKPGKCDMKLSEPMIKSLQAALFRGKSVDTIYQDLLFTYVQSYLAKGNAALYQYNDEKKVVRVLDEFKGILAGSIYLKDRYPELFDYLDQEKSPPGIESFIYWSKETLGFRPVITITHVSILKFPPSNVVISSKQIYANHYMNASLSNTVLVSDHEDFEKPGFHMMYINRSRTDMLGGLFAGLKRSIAKSRSITALKENILLTKKRTEEEFEEPASPSKSERKLDD